MSQGHCPLSVTVAQGPEASWYLCTWVRGHLTFVAQHFLFISHLSIPLRSEDVSHLYFRESQECRAEGPDGSLAEFHKTTYRGGQLLAY